MNIIITVEKLSEGKYKASALSQGFEVHAEGTTTGSAMRNLQGELKTMFRFARIARTALDIKMGHHHLTFKIDNERYKNRAFEKMDSVS